jgi:hypothetical protein
VNIGRCIGADALVKPHGASSETGHTIFWPVFKLRPFWEKVDEKKF